MIPIDEIAREQGLDPEDVMELLADFLDYSEEQDLESLRDGIRKDDLTLARNAAHSIKGAALNLKLFEIAKIAQRIESMCDAGTFQGLSELYEDLTLNFKALRAASADK